MLKLGKVLNRVSPLLEFHQLLLKDIQLLLDGETMWILLPLVSFAFNHIV
jgi:hypothetical protein